MSLGGAAVNQDFTTYRGNAVAPIFTVKNAEGVALDISTVVEIEWSARRDLNSAVVLRKKKTAGQIEFVTNGVDGQFQVIITDADTLPLSGNYIHEATLTDTEDDDTTVSTGTMSVQLAAPQPNAIDLATLGAVKAWMGVPFDQTSGDTLLAQLITSASRFLLNYLSRGTILSTTYTERFSGTGWGQTSLLLPRWPVTSVASLLIDGNSIAASVPAVAGTPNSSGFLLESWDGVPAGKQQSIDLFGYGFSKGAQNITVTYTAGYLVSGEAAVVPAADVVLVPLQPYGRWAADAGVVSAAGAAFVKVTGTPGVGQYAIDATTAGYTFNAADAGTSILLSYSFVPYDLAQACIQLVAEQSSYRSRIGIASKTLGGQETITYSTKNLTPDISLLIQNYKNVVPFV